MEFVVQTRTMRWGSLFGFVFYNFNVGWSVGIGGGSKQAVLPREWY